ncbi:MAG: tRNA 2-thiouridine(34) synthase MnmA [Pseudomonadota bacterium]|nr:tRNA 2-thiouridine(34) synthase MnmA [Pseudomonadota bacterium]
MNNKKERVVVAMSGGVDSSVAAALMVQEGYEVIGITLQLYNYNQTKSPSRTCCAGQDIYDAKKVADKLNIPHYVLNYEDRFKSEVIDDFKKSYISGITPIPCVRCNERIKFRDLLQTARNLGAKSLVTGHYVRQLQSGSGLELHRASDKDKDQSYFLFSTTFEQLRYLTFPLGSFSKNETRSIASKHGLAIAGKPDSQDICFVPDGDYASTLELLQPNAGEPGNITLEDGTVVGTHKGVIRYTVGQRKGLQVPWEEPLYVIKLDPGRKKVIVGPRSSLRKTSALLENVNWLDPSAGEKEELHLSVKVRSSSPGVPAKIRPRQRKRAEILFEKSPGAVAPGQAAVFYRGTRLIGGGWICK